MDSDGSKRDGDDGASETDPMNETSFITASEGTGSDPSSETAVRQHILGDGNHDNIEHATVPSSRSMPVPEYMSRQRKSLDDTDAAGDRSLPPPSYDEAVGHAEDYHVHQPGAGDNDGDSGPEGATGGDDELTPEEIAVIMQTQEARSSYLPSDSRSSYAEAIEMIDKVDGGKDQLRSEVTFRPSSYNGSSRYVEEGRSGRSRQEEYTCTSCGPLNEPVSRVCRMLGRQSSTRLVLFSGLIILVLGLLLFVSLFPASFVYLDYHQIALKQSKMTNVVDRDTVYYGGCYVLGPDTQFVRFKATSHDFSREMNVFTLDTISITIRYSVHYFIRPKEVGQLYSMFMNDYEDVFALIFRSQLRTLAGTSLTVDNFRFNRTYVERQMHNLLRRKFGGDCCPDCCKSRDCQHMDYCNSCKSTGCEQGYHIDVRYFNLLSVSIPAAVFERYLRSVILEVNKEREFFIQDHKVTVKETEQLTQKIKNEANEVTMAGQSEADKIHIISQAEKEKVVQSSYATAYKELYSRLNITSEDLKLSLMYIQALRQHQDNLYAGYGFEQNTLYMSP